MTWLTLVNYYLLQWFFVRLARVLDDEGRQVGWTVLRWPRPLSGYDGRPWRWLGGVRRP